MANTVQNTFFHDEAIQGNLLSIASFYKPATQCGGDWWGHFDIGDGRELLLVGDATGHGVPAALVTAIAYTVGHMHANDCKRDPELQKDPGKMLSILNKLLFRTLKGELYMSFGAVILDPRHQKLYYANGGHPFPLLIPASSSDKRLKENQITLTILPHKASGGILGLSEDTAFPCGEHAFLPGDRVLLYTDGLIEAKGSDNKQWGKRGLQSVLRQSHGSDLRSVKETIVKSILNYNKQGDQFDDDVTLVLAEYVISREIEKIPPIVPSEAMPMAS